MLEIASKAIGDPDWPMRPTTPENRVPGLQTTEMMIASAILPTHRVQRGLILHDSLTYLGPSNSEDVFTTPIAYQYAVKNDRTMFFTGIPQAQLPMKTCVTRSRNIFRMRDWEKFPLYPENREGNGNLLLSKSELPSCVLEGEANEPFRGEGKFSQTDLVRTHHP